MKINKNDVLEGYTLSVNGPPDEWEEWCNNHLPVILASLVDVPNDVYTLWEVPQNPKGYPDTPELDRELVLKPDQEIISDFLIWVQDTGMSLCRATEEDDPQAYRPIMISLDLLVSSYFGSNLEEAEKEKKAILEHLTNKYEGTTAPLCAIKITSDGVEEDINLE